MPDIAPAMSAGSPLAYDQPQPAPVTGGRSVRYRTRHRFASEISSSIFLRFFGSLAGFVLTLVVTAIIGRLILGSFTWYWTDPLYPLLSFINDNLTLLIVAFSIIGFIVIFVHYWRKTLGFIDAIVEATDDLITPGESLIQLPPELRSVEVTLNLAKQETVLAARQAQQAEQRKNDLIVYLAHDIRTPLTSVIAYLSLLDEAPDMPAEQRAKYVGITLDKAHRLERLINEFFEITRYNLQTLSLNKTATDLTYMLEQLTDEIYPLLSASGKRVAIHVTPGQSMYGDPDQLARVFNNILKNAASYAERNSVITITAAETTTHLMIAFRSVGVIPAEKLAAIFEKFYRLDEARSSDTGGAGLGLAIAQQIATQHGGQIQATSDHATTTFTVVLPVAPANLQ